LLRAISPAKADRFCLRPSVWINPNVHAACQPIPALENQQPVDYVLPSNVKEHNASMRCYRGDISHKELAIADSSGFCYAPQTSGTTNSQETMALGALTRI
jgi:hypothetical protein